GPAGLELDVPAAAQAVDRDVAAARVRLLGGVVLGLDGELAAVAGRQVHAEVHAGALRLRLAGVVGVDRAAVLPGALGAVVGVLRARLLGVAGGGVGPQRQLLEGAGVVLGPVGVDRVAEHVLADLDGDGRLGVVEQDLDVAAVGEALAELFAADRDRADLPVAFE